MNDEQARRLIKNVFQSRFDKSAFEEFLLEFLPGFDLTKIFGPLSGNVIRAAFRDRIASYERVGQYADPDQRKIDVLIINLNRETTLQHGRTGLRNFAADYLQSDRGIGKAAVLLAYVPSDGGEWRFSFVALETSLAENDKGKFKEVIEKITPARRKSFLVGETERSHTAQSRFVKWIGSRNAPTVQEIEDCFDVESVTKEFFAKYKLLYERTRDAILELCGKDALLRQEFLNIGLSKKDEDEWGEEILVPNADDFAKKLLGQIVFLYFLQRKGWFGVKKEWGDGDKKFLRHLFDNREDYLTGRNKQRTCNYFNDILEPLFYEALAYPRERDYSKQFDCKIPFLNGGLFEPIYGYDWQQYDLLLPDDLFSNNRKTKEGDLGDGILDVFDRYNFTVNESEPLETEVAVDPEMLGKVFENLLPENERHGKGAYYTPRPIVAYMCQQSLINYLATHFESIDRNDLEMFIVYGEQHADFEARSNKANEDKLLPASIRSRAHNIDEKLADIKVCDPAIGSGAFPVGMMHEIVRARQTLSAIESMPDQDTYQLKRHAIENSIYGVDIDSGAIEIAKLRLWLSLVVDEEDRKTVQPLPNLDFKIMQGDSLIDEFRGIRLFDDAVVNVRNSHADNSEQIKVALKERIAGKSKEFFSLHSRGEDATSIELHTLRKEITVLQAQLDAMSKQNDNSVTGPDSLYAQTDEPSKAALRFADLKVIHQAIIKETQGEQKQVLRKAADELEHEFVSEHLREVETRLLREITSLRSTLNDELKNVKIAMRFEIETPKIRKLNKQISVTERELADLSETQAELEGMDFSKFKPFFLWHLHFFEVFQENDGFDIVMANPPYVRQEEIKGLKLALERKFQTYSGTADLYVYFYEQGVKLLKKSGALVFITSNKYFRAGYGEKLRKLLSTDTTIRQIVDFGDAPVFEATAYACVILLQRQTPNRDKAQVWSLPQNGAIEAFEQKFKAYSFELAQSDLKLDGWRLESPSVLSLFERLLDRGVPLQDYVHGRLFRGIVTGLNEAFVVDQDTRDRLISEDKSSVELLKPYLRGRDVKRWKANSRNLWLIFTRRGTDIMKYPAIKRHLEQFKDKLVPGSKGGRKAGSYQWFEIQDNIAYWQEFEKPKIIIPAIEKMCAYAPDLTGYYTNDKTTICMPDSVNYLLGILNSKIHWWYMTQCAAQRMGGFLEFKPMYISKFPIPESSSQQRAMIELFVGYIIHTRLDSNNDDSRASLMISYFEQIIDALCYELYLTDEIHDAEKYFFGPLEKERLQTIDDITGHKHEHIREAFERLFDRNHIVRKNIYFLDTLESVRIIEGKL
ncbi:MAG: N-6 DNA methylase [Pyrinomonadaceae bacterium]